MKKKKKQKIHEAQNASHAYNTIFMLTRSDQVTMNETHANLYSIRFEKTNGYFCVRLR